MAIMSKSKEMNYFETLSAMTKCANRAAIKLDDLIRNYSDVTAKADAIHEIEHESDMLYHKMVHALTEAFITPIDREDLIKIGHDIDNITDAIEDAANYLDMLSIQECKDDAKKISLLIVEATEAVMASMIEFETFKKRTNKVHEFCIKVNDIEAKGDKLHRASIKALYNDKTLPTLDVIKWHQIYDIMEDVLDSCEDVSVYLETLMAKHM